jgi:hypothetical protein
MNFYDNFNQIKLKKIIIYCIVQLKENHKALIMNYHQNMYNYLRNFEMN